MRYPATTTTWFPGVRAALAARYELPGEDCFYTRDLAGLRFIFLDVAYWTSVYGDTTLYLDKELYDQGKIRGLGPSWTNWPGWSTELAKADRPMVIVSHAPLGYKPAYPMPTLPYGTPAQQPETSVADLMGDVLDRNAMREMMRRCPQVKIAFAGHWHIADVFREDGVTFCQTGSCANIPLSFASWRSWTTTCTSPRPGWARASSANCTSTPGETGG